MSHSGRRGSQFDALVLVPRVPIRKVPRPLVSLRQQIRSWPLPSRADLHDLFQDAPAVLVPRRWLSRSPNASTK
jgi:hypothetical protein